MQRTQKRTEDAALYHARLAAALAQIDGRSEARPARRRGRDPLTPTGAQWFYMRWCALECMHLWPAPPIVRQYLESGDPELATLRDDEKPMRETAAGVASQYCTFSTHRLPFGPAQNAAWSAMYAATGNMAGAASNAISALAEAALDAALLVTPELPPADRRRVMEEARARLQGIFADRAREIFEGERHA